MPGHGIRSAKRANERVMTDRQKRGPPKERRLERERSLKPKRVEPKRGGGGGTGEVGEREGAGERRGVRKESEQWIY